MARTKTRNRKMRIVVYCFLIAGIFWQSSTLLKFIRSSGQEQKSRSLQINVEGNVRRPGLYTVPEGTTQFEILRVAGVRLTSDLSSLNLSSQVNENSEMNIGTLDEPVKIKNNGIAARLEFYFGELNIIGSDGRNTPRHEGLEISTGDRLITEASSQAEVSIGSYSRIDIDNFSELIFDKIGVTENGKSTVELFQKSGLCWYKTVYTKSKNDQLKVVTSSSVTTVGGTGADFLIDIQSNQIQINLMDGLLLVERVGGGETINLISGQSVIIYNDGRPFQVSKLSPDLSANERFSQLSREKVKAMTRLMPFNMLFCGVPTVFYLISLQHETGDAHIISIPPSLLIDQFAQDISTLDEAFLFGGPAFASTFIERILDIRISKYTVFDKDDVMRTADALGGIPTNVDSKSASALNIPAGANKLSGKSLALYLAPSMSGMEGGLSKQSVIIKNMFEEFRNKKATLTLLLADQILHNTETNITGSEAMQEYTKFMGRKKWVYKEVMLPTRIAKRGDKVCYEPDLKECKKILNSYE